eukprot:scaffold24_cov128-Cylindrotheca_fusiformis.AAC.26
MVKCGWVRASSACVVSFLDGMEQYNRKRVVKSVNSQPQDFARKITQLFDRLTLSTTLSLGYGVDSHGQVTNSIFLYEDMLDLDKNAIHATSTRTITKEGKSAPISTSICSNQKPASSCCAKKRASYIVLLRRLLLFPSCLQCPSLQQHFVKEKHPLQIHPFLGFPQGS